MINEEENNRKITETLQSIYEREKRNRRYFQGVSSGVFKSDFNTIHKHLITVEGQLLHRSSIGQFSPSSESVLQLSKGEWVLGDFPPHGLVNNNNSFDGKLLLLKEDDGFTAKFSKLLPFCTDIGWYPYVRITGCFDNSRLAIDALPTLSIIFTEYRRPKLFRGVRDELKKFAEREIWLAKEPPEYLSNPCRSDLKYWSYLVLFGYLFPILFRGSNLEATKAEVDIAVLLHEYQSEVSNDLPNHLKADFRDAIELAQKMGAKMWELRATISFARLLANQGRRDEARSMLAEIYNWFTEGFDTADLKEAKALLDELSR